MPDELSLRGIVSMLGQIPIVGEVHAAQNAEACSALIDAGRFDTAIASARVDQAILGVLAAAATRDGVKVLLTVRRDERSAARMSVVPAAGYLIEPELTAATLHRALLDVARAGAVSVSPSLLRGLLAVHHRAEKTQRAPRLSDREREVLSLLATGASNQQIATALGISIHGAKRHVANLLAKLNCANRAAAVSAAIRAGLIVQS